MAPTRNGLPRLVGLLRRGAAAAMLAGPAVMASVAYVDPGNFATNIESGARFGYRLLWVVVLANAAAMLFQALAGKLGIVTGKSLASLCRVHFPAPLVYLMWGVSEVGAMATDLAEFLGASVGFALLLHLPLLAGALLTAAITWGILASQRGGVRRIEVIIAALVGIIDLCYIVETAMARPDPVRAAYHAVVPWLGGSDSIMLAAGIVGATVMPHAIFLHSSLARHRTDAPPGSDLRRVLRASNWHVVAALGLAGLVNMAMIFVAAAVFHDTGRGDVASIESAYQTLGPLLGDAAAAVFLTSLIASGLSSSVVGTMAGQIIMGDFVGWRTPLWLRRLVTMLPTLAIIAWGIDATRALVASQVVLSLVLPAPMIALLYFTACRRVLGSFANPPALTALAAAAAAVILTINALLLLQVGGVVSWP